MQEIRLAHLQPVWGTPISDQDLSYMDYTFFDKSSIGDIGSFLHNIVILDIPSVTTVLEVLLPSGKSVHCREHNLQRRVEINA